ncbi:MAG: MarR family transcriptional regulator [Capsulimonas sp.]|uniref:MarR family winged helix-turn-helix transcriptional regulator n=1 Tax=Capsulimonas sp. TaxID=2494211 RepID=UPI0032640CCE
MTNATKSNFGENATLPEQMQQVLMRVARLLITPAEATPTFLDLSLLEIRCLRIIAGQEGQKLREVAVHMDLSLPGVSRLVDRLVKDGLVLRQIDPLDRRAVQLGTTEKSREILDDLRRAREDHIAACTAHLPSEQMETILGSLRLLADAAEQAQERKTAD